jgi:predicted dehydrogenase
LANGCINEWAPHEIDLARYLMDDDLRLVDKYVDRLETNLGLLGWGSGCHVHVHSDMRYRGNMRGGHVLTDDNEYRWDFSAHPVSNNDYLEELKAFIEYAESGQAPLALATGEDGLAVLKLCERADNVRLGK